MKVKSEVDVLILHYPYHKELKQEVCHYLKNQKDCQNKSTNVKATMTDWSITTPQIEKLKPFIISNIQTFLFPTKGYIFNNFWANIYYKGDYTIEHDHIPNAYSFVYFLDVKKYHPPLIFSFDKKKIYPEDGKIVIFPSILKHSVPKNKYEETRITLAGNISWQNT
jgi:hypothetical protein